MAKQYILQEKWLNKCPLGTLFSAPYTDTEPSNCPPQNFSEMFIVLMNWIWLSGFVIISPCLTIQSVLQLYHTSLAVWSAFSATANWTVAKFSPLTILHKHCFFKHFVTQSHPESWICPCLCALSIEILQHIVGVYCIYVRMCLPTVQTTAVILNCTNSCSLLWVFRVNFWGDRHKGWCSVLVI